MNNKKIYNDQNNIDDSSNDDNYIFHRLSPFPFYFLPPSFLFLFPLPPFSFLFRYYCSFPFFQICLSRFIPYSPPPFFLLVTLYPFYVFLSSSSLPTSLFLIPLLLPFLPPPISSLHHPLPLPPSSFPFSPFHSFLPSFPYSLLSSLHPFLLLSHAASQMDLRQAQTRRHCDVTAWHSAAWITSA